MWVRVMEWMIVDGEPPLPAVGTVLRSVGARVRGSVTAADPATRDGVVGVPGAVDADRPRSVYALTGLADDARDVLVGSGRRGEGEQTVGAELVLTVGGDRFQVSFDGRASDVSAGSRVTVTGALALVGEYEWEAFDLVDTRADWIVTDVVPLSNGDIVVDLKRVQDDERHAP